MAHDGGPRAEPPGDPGRRSAIPPAALCLLGLAPVVDAQVLFGWRWAPLLAVPLLTGYFALCWPRIMLNAKILLLGCLALAGVVLLREGGLEILAKAIERMSFFPVFVAMLALLRAAAGASDTTAKAGALLVRQPPSRRYLALTAGGHIFGILLNIGGLALLLDMTKRANTLEAGFGEARIVAMRERRMTLAVMRGFACIAMWSPLGLALNLLLASVPDLAWIDIAPYGFVGALAFMVLGFVFDRLEFPPPTRPRVQVDDPGGVPALLKLIGHIGALSGLAMLAEVLTERPFQAILINLVPLYAVVWLLANAISQRRPRRVAFTLSHLREGGLVRWPHFANEISIFAASGFLGVVLATLAPREALQAAFAAAALPPGVVAAGLTGSVVVLGFLGLNPMISASILAATLASITVPGLSHVHAVLALAAGWTCVIGVAPLMSSLVMTATLIGRRSIEVGVIWNGRFTIAAVVVAMVAVLLVPL